MSIGDKIKQAYEKGVTHWASGHGFSAHRISSEEYYSIRIDVYGSYVPIFEGKE